MDPSSPSPPPGEPVLDGAPAGSEAGEPGSQADAPDADADHAGRAGPSDARRKTRHPHKTRTGTKLAIEWLVLIGSALVIALLIKTFLFQAFYIPSESMVPTLEKGDRVLVNKLSYKLHDVNRGDIVVFEAPPGTETDQVKDLVKRVVGLPNERIELRKGRVFVNGRVLDEPYLQEGVRSNPIGTCGSRTRWTVPNNAYFVMGDNRSESKDSRCFDAIPEDTIVGRAFVRIWPLNRFTFL